VLQYLFLWSISLGTKHNTIQYAGANSAIGRNGGRPSKKKQPYVRPKATVVTPDQAEAQLRAKTAIESKEFANCFELILEARKRHEQGGD
jgi:hypothetical protein